MKRLHKMWLLKRPSLVPNKVPCATKKGCARY